VKISVSVPDRDLERLDRYVREAGLASRSAAIQRAIRLLDGDRLEQDYAAAFEEWDASGERDAWEAVAGDGLDRAPR